MLAHGYAGEVTSDLSKPTRVERRKARTRQALIEAGQRILAERGTSDVSIQDITDEADVGFGSFYNHFSTKSQLFEEAVGDTLEAHGRMLDQLTMGIDDPAEVFSTSVRLTAMLASTQPEIARVFVASGMSFLVSDRGLAPQALRDIERGIGSGRFTVHNPYVALAAAAGCLLSFLQISLDKPQILDGDAVDELAERLLRMFGMAPRSARAVAHRPLPTVGLPIVPSAVTQHSRR